MASVTGSKELTDLALLINRLSLGMVFLLAGAQKIAGGINTFYEKGFLSLKPSWLPVWFAWPYGHALPFLELVLGAMLIVGLFSRTTAGLIAIMLFSFTIALASKGMFFANGPIHPNVVYLTLAVLLAVLGAGSLSADRMWRKRG